MTRLILLLALSGCGATTSDSVWCGSRCNDGGLSGDLSAGGGNDGQSSGTLVSVAVTPDNQVLNLQVGTTQSIPYTATATYSDGTTAPVDGTWALADPSIGSIDPVIGLFVANGIVGGNTDVQFTLAGMSAVASVTVNLASTLAPTPSPVPAPTRCSPPPERRSRTPPRRPTSSTRSISCASRRTSTRR